LLLAREPYYYEADGTKIMVSPRADAVMVGGGVAVKPTGGVGFRFKETVRSDVRTALLSRFDIESVKNDTRDPDYYYLQLSPGADPFAAAAAIFESGTVIWAQPDWLQEVALAATPDDTFYANQWHHPMIASAEAWDITTGGENVIIGIVDSGVQTAHPDLMDNLLPGFDPANNDTDPNPDSGSFQEAGPHGTCVAGLAAARGNNGLGVTGMCWNCKILPVKIFPSPAGVQWQQLSMPADGIKWAVDNGAWVINNSWGPNGTKFINNCTAVARNQFIDDAIAYAKANGRGGLGTITVWAAGNSACNSNFDPNLLNDDAIVVSALNESEILADYSNYGFEIDVAAPAGGSNTGTTTTDMMGADGYVPGYTAFSDQNYTPAFNGTSAAAPIVTGAIALMLAAKPDITFDQAVQCIKNAGDKIDPDGAKCPLGPWGVQPEPYGGVMEHSWCYGFGRLNVKRLIETAVSGDCSGRVVGNDEDPQPDDAVTPDDTPVVDDQPVTDDQPATDDPPQTDDQPIVDETPQSDSDGIGPIPSESDSGCGCSLI